MVVRTCKPSTMTKCEKDDFIAFVSAAGEVNLGTLLGLVNKADMIATIHFDQLMIGTAAIKIPSENYRRTVFCKANVKDLADAYPLELGWVVVHDDHRRKGLARTLVEAAIKVSSGQGLYATTKSDTMRKLFPQQGFAELGEAYASTQGEGEMLTLFVRPAFKVEAL